MRQRILGSHTPPCHRRMVITTQFGVLLCCTAAQTSSVPLQVVDDCALALAICTSGSGGGGGGLGIGPFKIHRTLQRQPCGVEKFFKGSDTETHPLCQSVLLDELVQSSWRQLWDGLLLPDTGALQFRSQSLNFLRLGPHGSCHALYVGRCPIIHVPHPDWCSHAVHATQKTKTDIKLPESEKTNNCLSTNKKFCFITSCKYFCKHKGRRQFG